jgi:hypothetical protein
MAEIPGLKATNIDLCVAAQCGGRNHRKGRRRSEGGSDLSVGNGLIDG